MPSMPLRRLDLVLQPSGDEIAIYDNEMGHFHTLNATAARVWAMCDGTRTVDEIVQAVDLPEPYVARALSQFAELGLLADASTLLVITRRGALRQIAVAGGIGSIALPVIASISGFESAAAFTCLQSGAPCLFSGPLCCTVCADTFCL